MAADIIWYVTVGGCGVLFFLIGVYARRKQTPMHFYAGTTVPKKSSRKGAFLVILQTVVCSDI